MKCHPCLFLLSFLLITSPSPAQEITLAVNGKTDYRIVIPKECTPEEKEAAMLLRKYLQKITRANLHVVTDHHTEIREEILIGNTNRTAGKHPLIYAPDLRGEGYWIKTSGKKLIILGGTGHGVLYGVYTLLEEYLGCRKFSPDDEFVPKNTTLRLPAIDRISLPAAGIRIVHGDYFRDDVFRHWRKLHLIGDFWGDDPKNRYYVHTFDKLVPPPAFFETHPEYFSLINGRRVPWGQLCLSNPDLVKIAVDHLREVMPEQPEVRYWSVSQNDNYYHCECDACRAIDSAEGSPAGTLLRFVNRVADSFPEKVITTLAYQYTRKPPKLTKPRENVMITLCTIELNRSLPIETDPGSRDFVNDIQGWSRICGNIKIWDYETQFTNYLCPFPLFHTLQPNIQFFNKFNATAHFQQCNITRGVDFGPLKAYLLSKLLWDQDIDVRAATEEFMQGYYGEAAPYILQYFELLHEELRRSGDRLDIYGSPVWHANTFLSEENIGRYNRLFDKAVLAVANKPVLLHRVRVARLPVQYATLEIAKTDLFGERGWYQKEADKYVLRKDRRELLEDFYNVIREEKMSHLNENGLKPEVYYQNTLRFIDVKTEGNLAFQRPVETTPPPDRRYFHKGPSMLTNGVRGTEDYKINWLGWEGIDPKITIDLGQEQDLREISVSTLQDPKSWIIHPIMVTCYLSSDGTHFQKAGMVPSNPDLRKEDAIRTFIFRPVSTSARYVRFFVTGTKVLPDWHPYRGNKSWVFIDEVVITR